MKISRIVKALCLIAAFAAFGSCGPIYDPDSEGTMENPVEISQDVHRGRVGKMITKLSGSYYTFVSEVKTPTIYYNNRSPDDDLDCGVYREPDYYSGFVKLEQGIWEDHCSLNEGPDYTGVRLYVHIGNYDDDNVVEYDIYYE